MKNMRQTLIDNAKAVAEKSNQTFSNNNDKLVLPYHNLNTEGNKDNVVEVRLLLDADTTNPDAWYINDTYHILETGWQKKEDGSIATNSNGEKIPERKFVACLKSRGFDYCPCCAKAQAVWKEYSDEKLRQTMYGKFKRKESYIAQVYVVNVPNIESMMYKDDQGNLVSRQHQVQLIKFGKKLLTNITNSLNDSEFWEVLASSTNNEDAIPFGFGKNYNYNIKIAKDGNFRNYDTSSFTRSVKVVDEPVGGVELMDLKQHQRKVLNVNEFELLVEQSYKFVTNDGATPVNEFKSVTTTTETFNTAKAENPTSIHESAESLVGMGLSPELIKQLAELNKNSA